MGLSNVNLINNPWLTQQQWGGVNSSLNNMFNNQWNSFNNFNVFDPYQQSFKGAQSNSGLRYGETFEDYYARMNKIATTPLAPKKLFKTPDPVKFTAKEEEILVKEFTRIHINPPSESLGSSIATQAGFGTVLQSKSIYNTLRRSETMVTLAPVARETMGRTWQEATWKDFIKPSEIFKNNRAFNDSVDELTKLVLKLEKGKGAWKSSNRIDPKLYDKILNESKEAIKSGDINKVKQVIEDAQLAKKVRQLDSYTATKKVIDLKAARNEEIKQFRESGKKLRKAIKGLDKTAERDAIKSYKTVYRERIKNLNNAIKDTEATAGTVGKAYAEAAEKAAVETAGKAGLKATTKSVLKTCSKCVPYIGDAYFAGMEIYGDWDKLKTANKKGGGALAKQCVHTGVKTAAVVGGFALGMKVGAAIGSCVPIPVVGTVVGAVVGGIIGGALSWLGAKLAKGTTKLVLGEEPGVEEQQNDLKKNNNYITQNGEMDTEKFAHSGHGTMVKGLLETYYTNGIGEDGISEEAAQILFKYGYINDAANPPLNYAA